MHYLIGRDAFVTRDEGLLARSGTAAQYDITISDAGTVVDALPRPGWARIGGDLASITLRAFERHQDEADVRAVLAPLADDYPDFGAWLNRTLADRKKTRIVVGELDGQVAAVAVSVKKDDRVLKLAAFYVAEYARAAALGSHLLWSEMRDWVKAGWEKVYVTVSSRHAELVEFFTDYGFLIEGVSARRYQPDTAEIVLAKHLLRERIAQDTLKDFAERVASVTFGAPAGVHASYWAIAPRAAQPEFAWVTFGPHLGLAAAEPGGRIIRRWSIAELERVLYPARFAVGGRRALLVPIERRWADALVEYVGQQGMLGRSREEGRLLLRADNAYYAYPKARAAARPGTPLLLYVMDPVQQIIGDARVFDARIDTPERLYDEFGGLGIYKLDNIRDRAIDRGPRAGQALVLHFRMYTPYPHPSAATPRARRLVERSTRRG